MFTGVSPEANVVITNNWDDEYLAGLTFTADKKNNISYGESVKITCNVSYEEIARHGFLAQNMEASYSADKLPGYIDDVSKIDRSVIEQVGKEVLDTITAETADTTFHMLYKATRILHICTTLMRKQSVLRRLSQHISFQERELPVITITTYT